MSIISHSRPHAYPYLYSEGVIDEFLKNYSRVVLFVSKKCHMSAKEFRFNMIKCFMYRNSRWNVLRETLKYIEKHQLYSDMAFYHGPDFEKYLTAVRSLVEDSLIDNEKLH